MFHLQQIGSIKKTKAQKAKKNGVE